MTTTTKALTPVAGGSLTVGLFSEIRGLDPLVSNGAANTGGFELGALYDRLVQWNPQTRTYDMRTAESLVANADSSEWTLKVKPNIKFTDGTAYDAAAVKFNLDRQQKENTVLRGSLAFIKETQVVDPLTVKFVLTESWGAFPFLLANTPGMLVSPTAAQKLGKDLPINPVGAGAGPFIFESFKSKEAIVLKRNPNYWGGQVYLDELRFIVTADSVNMAGEAAATGKPIHIFTPSGGSGKFARFHAGLAACGATRELSAEGLSETWTYVPLNSAPQIAAEILRRMQIRGRLLPGLAGDARR